MRPLSLRPLDSLGTRPLSETTRLPFALHTRTAHPHESQLSLREQLIHDDVDLVALALIALLSRLRQHEIRLQVVILDGIAWRSLCIEACLRQRLVLVVILQLDDGGGRGGSLSRGL